MDVASVQTGIATGPITSALAVGGDGQRRLSYRQRASVISDRVVAQAGAGGTGGCDGRAGGGVEVAMPLVDAVSGREDDVRDRVTADEGGVGISSIQAGVGGGSVASVLVVGGDGQRCLSYRQRANVISDGVVGQTSAGGIGGCDGRAGGGVEVASVVGAVGGREGDVRDRVTGNEGGGVGVASVQTGIVTGSVGGALVVGGDGQRRLSYRQRASVISDGVVGQTSAGGIGGCDRRAGGGVEVASVVGAVSGRECGRSRSSRRRGYCGCSQRSGWCHWQPRS